MVARRTTHHTRKTRVRERKRKRSQGRRSSGTVGRSCDDRRRGAVVEDEALRLEPLQTHNGIRVARKVGHHPGRKMVEASRGQEMQRHATVIDEPLGSEMEAEDRDGYR